MAKIADLDHDQLIDRLADGFTALLTQVEELKRHNEEVEKLLGRQHKSLEGPGSEEHRDQEQCKQRAIEALKMLKMTRLNTAAGGQALNEPETSSTLEKRPPAELKGPQKMTCPFASMTKEQMTERQSFTLPPSKIQRPNSLPTPPETREQYLDGANAETVQEEQNTSQASVTDSVSKCPIRMLDERPAEEVAEYFETHKHEIPRSHEICVKRYQSNEQSLRQLDAKYGSLVNMIQGLGMKHQPLLHDKDGADGSTKPNDAIEQWANTHMHSSEHAKATSFNDALEDPEERIGYFDRPLKEIRVGESPSRPWGISVPTALLQPQDSEELQGEGTPGPVPEPKETKPSNTTTEPKVFNHKKQTSDLVRGDKPHVIFNGPVLIGYAPEEAAAFLKQCGMSK